ncbi:unnamed protein product [Diplocarpon coronariae]
MSSALPEGAGYGVVVGIGFFFAFLMYSSLMRQNRYTNYSTKESEEFNTASRSVKSGLIAAGIVSAWTWAATLLQSSTVAYQYGISGPFWYAAGATVQIFMFAVIACKVKQNAPRYGSATHIVFIFFALLTNILVASQLLLGGSAVVTALTGMDVYAAIFLIPLGVCVYVVLGGLRATFLCDYTHTFIVLIIIIYFMFSVYVKNALIGSPTAMFDLLVEASKKRPVAGNQNGSYLTLKSNFALIFVFLDQGYWQRAIASRPTTAVPAYIMGGLAWFAIPFGFATTLGLATVALTDNPAFPTYPNEMTSSQITSGLSAPFAAVALLGDHGAIALLVTLFMAVTSSASAELIAVSSVFTFDIYKMYMNPFATPKQTIRVSHMMICVFAIGIDLGWLFLTMGLLIGGAVFPSAFAITWVNQSKYGALGGALGGLAAGLAAWLITAKTYYGELTITSTGASYPTLAGNMAAVLSGLMITLVTSYIKPDNFDWEITRGINAPLQDGVVPRALLSGEQSSPNGIQDPEKTVVISQPGNNGSPLQSEERREALEDRAIMEDPTLLRGAFKYAVVSAVVLTLLMDIVIPIPMFLSHYIFSKGFFVGWVVVSFIWVFCSLAICALLPIWEARVFFVGFWKELGNGRRESKAG